MPVPGSLSGPVAIHHPGIMALRIQHGEKRGVAAIVPFIPWEILDRFGADGQLV